MLKSNRCCARFCKPQSLVIYSSFLFLLMSRPHYRRSINFSDSYCWEPTQRLQIARHEYATIMKFFLLCLLSLCMNISLCLQSLNLLSSRISFIARPRVLSCWWFASKIAIENEKVACFYLVCTMYLLWQFSETVSLCLSVRSGYVPLEGRVRFRKFVEYRNRMNAQVFGLFA